MPPPFPIAPIGTSFIPRFINRSGGVFPATNISSRYVSGFASEGWRPKNAPDSFRPWVNKTIGGGLEKRNLEAEGRWIRKAVFEAGWDAMPGKWFGFRDVTFLDHSWLTVSRGESNTNEWNKTPSEREAWMKANALQSMMTTLLENGCSPIPDDYAVVRARLNLKGIKGILYGYDQKYGMDASVRSQVPDLYANIRKGMAISLGNNMVRTATNIEEIELPGGGKMWGIINAVTSDHAFSSSLTWWRGYDAEGKPFTIVYGGGGDVIPVLQPILNPYSGEMLFAQCNDVFDVLCDPANEHLRAEDLSTITWNQELKDKIWNELPARTQNIRLVLDMFDGFSGPFKLLKSPIKRARNMINVDFTEDQYSEIEQYLSERLKAAHDQGSTEEFAISEQADRKAVAEVISSEFTGKLMGETSLAMDQLAEQLDKRLAVNPPSDKMEEIVNDVMEIKMNLDNSDLSKSLTKLDALSIKLKDLNYEQTGNFTALEVETMDLIDKTTQHLRDISNDIEVFEKQQEDPEFEPADPIEPVEDPNSIKPTEVG